MEHLLTFAAELDSKGDPTAADETKLFEAFYIGYTAFDHPEYGDEMKLSRRAEEEIVAKTVEGGSIRFEQCILCGSRGRHFGEELRTLPKPKPGEKIVVDLIFGEKTWPYVKARFAKWKGIPRELRNYFIALDERFESIKPKTHEEIAALLKLRDATIMITETDKKE